jgi:hypothetical protein
MNMSQQSSGQENRSEFGQKPLPDNNHAKVEPLNSFLSSKKDYRADSENR